MTDPLLFTPCRLGNLTLRNRSIRSAAFEGMCPDHNVSEDLISYHRSVAAGGVAMTTVAYASVSGSGLSFNHQLWLRKEVVHDLKRLTDAVHKEGAAAAIQIGHCGLMAKKKVTGGICLAPTGKFNLYGPTWPRTINKEEIQSIITDFGNAIEIARESGFDAVEVHAGHGYLISQFLSPYTNRRKDEFGGSFENRTRFMTAVIREVLDKAKQDITVLVKINMRDGFSGGMETEESLEVAGILEKEGVHAMVLSGGFVSKAPMYVMRGHMPVEVLSHYMRERWMKPLIRYFGEALIRPEPFSEAYFLADAMNIRKKIRIPLVYVGGMISLEGIEKVLSGGFEFIQIARALIHDPAFISKLKSGEITRSGCNHSNYCIAVMYSGKMACYQNRGNIPPSWKMKFESRAQE